MFLWNFSYLSLEILFKIVCVYRRWLSESETRAADAVANVTVSGSIQRRMSLSLLEHKYEEVFSMALDTDDTTLGWLLSKVSLVFTPWDSNIFYKTYSYYCFCFSSQVEGLQRFFPADKKNIQSLLVQLAHLVTAEAGEYTNVFSLWFEVMLKKAVVSGLEITKEVREAKEHIEKKHQRGFASIDRKFSDYLL